MRTLFILLFSVFCFSALGQSKIKQAKEKLSEDTKTEFMISEFPARETSSSFLFEEGSSFLTEILLNLTVGLAYYVAFETPIEQRLQMYDATLNPYPFYAGAKGDYKYAGWDNFVLWRIDASNYYFSEKSKFHLNDLNLKFRIGSRFALNVKYLHFWEKLLAPEDEKLDVFSATLQYFRIRTPHVSMHWGLGASYIANNIKQFGFVTELGTEFFIKPFSIHCDFKGDFFKKNDIYVFSVGPKFYFRNYNFGINYQYVNLASSKASGVSFGVGFVL